MSVWYCWLDVKKSIRSVKKTSLGNLRGFSFGESETFGSPWLTWNKLRKIDWLNKKNESRSFSNTHPLTESQRANWRWPLLEKPVVSNMLFSPSPTNVNLDGLPLPAWPWPIYQTHTLYTSWVELFNNDLLQYSKDNSLVHREDTKLAPIVPCPSAVDEGVQNVYRHKQFFEI